MHKLIAENIHYSAFSDSEDTVCSKALQAPSVGGGFVISITVPYSLINTTFLIDNINLLRDYLWQAFFFGKLDSFTRQYIIPLSFSLLIHNQNVPSFFMNKINGSNDILKELIISSTVRLRIIIPVRCILRIHSWCIHIHYNVV